MSRARVENEKRAKATWCRVFWEDDECVWIDKVQEQQQQNQVGGLKAKHTQREKRQATTSFLSTN